MMRVVELSEQEKTELYMKLTKKELVEMLIECNRLINILTNKYETAN